MSKFMERAAVRVAEVQDSYLMGIYSGAFANARRDQTAAAATAETFVQAALTG